MTTPQHPTGGQYRVALFLLLVMFALAGCSGSTPTGPSTDDRDVAAAVAASIPDAASNAKSFKALFAGDAPEKERTRYTKYQFRTPEKATVSGDTATVKVVVHDDNAGKDVGTVTWELVKQGDKWKLKSAPLP